MIDPIDIIYSKKLRSLRLSKNWKQHVASDMLGLSSQQEYSKLENGKIHYSEELIRKICLLFKIKIRDFKTVKTVTSDNDLDFLLGGAELYSQPKTISHQAHTIIVLNYRKILIEKDLKITELELSKLLPKNNFDLPKDKEYKIYVML